MHCFFNNLLGNCRTDFLNIPSYHKFDIVCHPCKSQKLRIYSHSKVLTFLCQKLEHIYMQNLQPSRYSKTSCNELNSCSTLCTANHFYPLQMLILLNICSFVNTRRTGKKNGQTFELSLLAKETQTKTGRCHNKANICAPKQTWLPNCVRKHPIMHNPETKPMKRSIVVSNK